MTLLPWEYFWIGFNRINFPDLFDQIWMAAGVLLIVLIVLYVLRTRPSIGTATTSTCGSGSSGAG